MRNTKVIPVFILGTLALFQGHSPFLRENEASEMRVNSGRLEQRLTELARFGKNAQGGIDRVAFSQPDIQGRNYVISLMQEAGLKVRVDQAGNIIGRREGKETNSPSITFGSHLDTVPNGGKYDGALGVMAAVECVQVLKERSILTRHPLEVIVFSDEEGGSVGSRAMIEELRPEQLQIVSQSDKTIGEGIRTLGGEPDKISQAVRKKGEVKAFIELHIEQGGILDAKKINIGVVEGIVGINRWEVIIQGFPNHAGTTPMSMRQDALLAASHFILAANSIVTSTPGSQVGTVGKIRVEPGAPNVIPGLAVLSLELRDLSSKKIQLLFQRILREAKAIEEKTGTKISFTAIDSGAVPAPTDRRLQECITLAARELGLTTLGMPSGAGHDAQNMARIAPMGMIFIPSAEGISHSPREYSRLEDIVNGADVLLKTILKIDDGCLDSKK